MAASDLYDAAAEILALCDLLLAGTSGGATDRSYVSQGIPADECSEVTVRTEIGVGSATTPGQQHKTGRRNEVTFTIRIVRCRPAMGEDGSAPTAAAENAYSQQTYQDAWAVWNGLISAQRSGDFLEGYCKSFDTDFGQPIPNTQVGGWEIICRAEMRGYAPTIT